MMNNVPTTLDPHQWYFPTSVAGYAVLLGLGAYAAHVCLTTRERIATDESVTD
jgi:hypothetical protein